MQKYCIADIAAICGVSKATVSRVINNKAAGVGEKKRNHVLATIKELGYRPNTLARSIATSSSRAIGVVVPDITNPFFPVQIRGINDMISPKGYSMYLGISDFDPQKEKMHLLSMVDRRVDGIILCSGVSNESFLQSFSQYNIPIVVMGRNFDHHVCNGSIASDSEYGASQAIRQLISTGNQRILYIDGNAGVSGAVQRYNAYKSTLSEAGIPFDEALVHFGEFSTEFGLEVTSRFLREGDNFTAVFTGSDIIAVGAIKAVKSSGRKIPDDIEIIGFDGIEISEIYDPAISTVVKPRRETAEHAASILLSIIQGTDSGMRHITVHPDLVLRETTKK
jgi:LacI family transcriptional regulator